MILLSMQNQRLSKQESVIMSKQTVIINVHTMCSVFYSGEASKEENQCWYKPNW